MLHASDAFAKYSQILGIFDTTSMRRFDNKTIGHIPSDIRDFQYMSNTNGIGQFFWAWFVSGIVPFYTSVNFLIVQKYQYWGLILVGSDRAIKFTEHPIGVVSESERDGVLDIWILV